MERRSILLERSHGATVARRGITVESPGTQSSGNRFSVVQDPIPIETLEGS